MGSIKRILDKYEAGMNDIVSKLEILNKDYEKTNNYILMEHIKYRLKSPTSIKHKLINDGYKYDAKNFDKINDIAGVRVVVAFEKDIYLVRQLIMQIPNLVIVKEKDFINNPKDSGYESFHMIVKIPVALSNGVEFITVEIQIRTLIMDVWASLHHKLVYKRENTQLEDIFVDYSNKLMKFDDELNKLKS